MPYPRALSRDTLSIKNAPSPSLRTVIAICSALAWCVIAIGLPVAYGFHAHDHARGLRPQLVEFGFFTSMCVVFGSTESIT